MVCKRAVIKCVVHLDHFVALISTPTVAQAFPNSSIILRRLLLFFMKSRRHQEGASNDLMVFQFRCLHSRPSINLKVNSSSSPWGKLHWLCFALKMKLCLVRSNAIKQTKKGFLRKLFDALDVIRCTVTFSKSALCFRKVDFNATAQTSEVVLPALSAVLSLIGFHLFSSNDNSY